MTEVKQSLWTNIHVTTLCPLCTDGTRIARTALAWRQHLEVEHDADANTWDDTGIRGGSYGVADSKTQYTRFPIWCYGCGATFATTAQLAAHVSDVHIPLIPA
jgi:hypothetical protein